MTLIEAYQVLQDLLYSGIPPHTQVMVDDQMPKGVLFYAGHDNILPYVNIESAQKPCLIPPPLSLPRY